MFIVGLTIVGLCLLLTIGMLFYAIRDRRNPPHML